jgi:para-nitrobenzyl esterase
VRRAENPHGAPHAAEIPFVFDTLNVDRRIAGKATAEDHQVADLVHACWVVFAKQPPDARTIACPGFAWPARTKENGQTVAIFRSTPSLGKASNLRSPPNGAAPGPTSRDEE